MAEDTALALFSLEQTPSKRCPQCGEQKLHSDFHRNRNAKDGLQSYCKDCCQRYIRAWEKANPDKFAAHRLWVRDYNRRRRVANRGTEELDQVGRGQPSAANPPVRWQPKTTKRCERCGEEKPLLEFHAYRGTRNRRTNLCKSCVPEHDAELIAKKRDYNARYARANRTRQRHATRKFRLRLYGLTPEALESMLSAQEHRCAICGGEGSETADDRPKLVVNHDHETSRVRALLCGPCNVMLGMAKDDPDRLRAAAEYIERHRGDSTIRG